MYYIILEYYDILLVFTEEKKKRRGRGLEFENLKENKKSTQIDLLNIK